MSNGVAPGRLVVTTGPLMTFPRERTYSLTYPQRPWLMNEDKKLHPMARHKLIQEWRTAGAWAAKVAKVPRLQRVAITVIHERINKRSMPDLGACFPAAKAFIDGLVDAHVVDHDGPEVVRSLTFVAPVISGRDALTIEIREVAE